MTETCDRCHQPCERCGTALRATVSSGKSVCWPCRDKMEAQK